MRTKLDPIAELATSAARAALPEVVTVGDATLLPRGADPFIGSHRPMLLTATRWAAVSPGGVLIGGTPAGLAAMFGFTVPEKPTGPTPPRKAGEPLMPRWPELIAEAARPALTTFSHAIANAVATLAGLPPDCAETQISLNDTDSEIRTEVGPISDAVVLLLHAGEHEARMVVVVPGVFLARMNDPVGDAEVVQTKGETMARPVAGEGAVPSPTRRVASEPLQAALASVPLDLSIELGSTSVPLAHVLHLGDGEVLELRQPIDAPVDLVSDETPVARGELEVDGVGNLVLHVTGIPGRRTAVGAPRLLDDADEGAGDPQAVSLDEASDAGDANPADPADGADAVPVNSDAEAAPGAPVAAAPDAPADVPTGAPDDAAPGEPDGSGASTPG